VSKFVYHWLATFLAVLIVSVLLPYVKGDLQTIALFALVISLLNAFLLPILRVLTFPLTVITLGLFSLVLNVIMFWLASQAVPGLIIGGTIGLLISALAISIADGLVRRVLPG
jgi:putative membrane protein